VGGRGEKGTPTITSPAIETLPKTRKKKGNRTNTLKLGQAQGNHGKRERGRRGGKILFLPFGGGKKKERSKYLGPRCCGKWGREGQGPTATISSLSEILGIQGLPQQEREKGEKKGNLVPSFQFSGREGRVKSAKNNLGSGFPLKCDGGEKKEKGKQASLCYFPWSSRKKREGGDVRPGNRRRGGKKNKKLPPVIFPLIFFLVGGWGPPPRFWKRAPDGFSKRRKKKKKTGHKPRFLEYVFFRRGKGGKKGAGAMSEVSRSSGP